MRHSLIITMHQLRLFFIERGNLVGLLVIPVAFTVVIGIFAGDDSQTERLRVDVVDHDDTDLSRELLAEIRSANTNLVLCPYDNDDDFCRLDDDLEFDEERIVERLEDEVALAFIEIPANFADDLLDGQLVQIVYRSNENITAPTYILQAVQAATQRLSGAVVAANVGAQAAETFQGLEFADDEDRRAFKAGVQTSASAIWSQDPITVDYVLTEGEDGEADDSVQDGFGQSVPGMGTMFVMFTVFGGTFILVRERQNWTLQRLATMPLSRAQILGGLILTMVVLGMIQYVVVFAVGVIAGLNLGDDPLALILIMLSFTLAVSALTFLMTGFVRTEGQAGSITTLLGLVLAPLGGAWWPLEIVPEFMQTIGHISPVAWAMDGFRELIFFDGNLAVVVPSILILLGYAAVFFVVGVWQFGYE